MAGLLHLVPRYLPRFGMAPRWVVFTRPLVLVLFAVMVIVTVSFDADVEAQSGAYATGVLFLMLSASIAAALALRAEARVGDRSRLLGWYCWFVAAVFAYTLVENVRERPDGIIIASIFIACIVVLSAISRYRRATELRVSKLTFCDRESDDLWRTIVGKKVNLVPIRTPLSEARRSKEQEIRKHYTVQGPLAFVHVKLLDNRSEFVAPIELGVERENGNYVIHVSQAIAIPNTIAFVSERLDPISIFLGLTRQNLVTQAFRFLLFGEGETGLMVYTILLKYWESTPEDDVRPLIFLMSD
jgi:hypothetical protein